MRTILLTATCLFAAVAHAQQPAVRVVPVREAPASPSFRRTDPRLAPGDRVAFPALEPFVRGEPIAAYKPGRVTVFEVFGTKCSHCEENFDLLCEIVRVFRPKGVEFVSVTAESADAVKAWLASPGKERVDWAVACDPTQTVARDWQNATLRNTTPRFFVVRDGVLLWVGHPNASEKPLERILEGSFDLAAFRKEFVLEANAAAANAAISAMTRRCQESGGWDPLFQLYDQVAEQLPERAGIVGVDRFTTMIGLADQVDAGYAYGRSLMERHGDDGRVLRAIARVVLTNATVRRRDVDFAMKAAEAAGVIGQDKDPKALEVLGLAWFAKGDRERAVAFVERAKSLETERKFLKQYDRTLARFRREKPGPMPPFVPRTGAATTVAPAPTAEGG